MTTPNPIPNPAAQAPVSRARTLLAGLLFALPLVLGTPERGAEAGPAGVTAGNWRYIDQTDALGNRSRAAYTRARGSDPNLVATFALRESNGTAEAILYLSSEDPKTSPPVPLCQRHGAPPAMIMFNDYDKPLPTVCDTDTSDNPRALFLGPVLPIWRSSDTSETVSIGVTVARQGLVVFTFPTGDVEWERILDPDQVRHLDRMTERDLRGEDTSDLWDMSTSQDFRKGPTAGRPKQRSQAPKSQAGASGRDLRS